MKKDMQLCIWAMKFLSNKEISFDFILRPMNHPDSTSYTGASSSIGIGGFSIDGQFFRCNRKDVNLHGNERDIQWMELSAIFVMVKLLEKTFTNKVVHIYTDNEQVK